MYVLYDEVVFAKGYHAVEIDKGDIRFDREAYNVHYKLKQAWHS